jgi:LysW-gamma-L-lysine carboxypeptidase
MVGLYSPSGQEAELARLVLLEMNSRGLAANIDEAGNVVGRWGTSGPTFLLCGHMDTVLGELPVRIEEDKLYGRGAVDAKSSLAAMICAAETLIAEQLPAKLIVVSAVDEEGKSRGIKHLIEKKTRADYAIFGEPSNCDSITIAYKGSLHLKLTCKTRGGHSSSPWLSRNAVDEALGLWKELCEIHFPEEKMDSRFYSITSALKEIHGGVSGSIIPESCSLRMDFRLPPNISSDRLLSRVNVITGNYLSTRKDVVINVDIEDLNEPFEAEPDSDLVRGFSWGIRDIAKKRPVLLRKTGTGDMNLFGAVTKIPIITYGPGDSRLDHTLDECVDLEEYKKSIAVLCQGIRRTLQLRSRSGQLASGAL